MAKIDKVKIILKENPNKWLITGVAGFIGSNLLEELLRLNQTVIGLDNFATGKPGNLEDVKAIVGPQKWALFKFLQGDITRLEDCRAACEGVDYVLHQAALGSVPRSIEDPVRTNRSNIDGFLNMLVAARDAKVGRFVYAASSSTYGDHPDLPKVEDRIGRPLSPYAVTKYVNELYADVFSRTYGIECIGLRYFNVFGRRQDPDGPYAAVIPKWIGILLKGERPVIYGDGKSSRDFCYIDNVVQANLLAATASNGEALNKVYNIAFGERTTLNQLYRMIVENVVRCRPSTPKIEAQYGPLRTGDVRHSLADVKRAENLLGYDPGYSVAWGLEETVRWFSGREPGGEIAFVSARQRAG